MVPCFHSKIRLHEVHQLALQREDTISKVSVFLSHQLRIIKCIRASLLHRVKGVFFSGADTNY